MNLYTFILDYAGGTYVSQVSAQDSIQAVDRWIKQLDLSKDESIGELDRDRLRKEFSQEKIGLVDGLKSVWCITVEIKDQVGIVHIVLTAVV